VEIDGVGGEVVEVGLFRTWLLETGTWTANGHPTGRRVSFLKGHWDRSEYAAGYRARFTAIPDFEGAHHCWRVGWEDADTEVLELARHNQAIAEGREDDYSDTWGLLFDAGGDARVNGIPFSEERTAPWKEGWIETDINLGVHGLEEQ